MANDKVQLFEDQPIRTAWVEAEEEWYFSVVDVVQVLTESADGRKYWNKLKQRLKEEGSQLVTNCHQLKMRSPKDGKLKTYDREFLKLGDGINEPERKVVKTEKIQPKLVYVTLELDNSLANSTDGNFYIPSLQFITKKSGKVYEMYYKDK